MEIHRKSRLLLVAAVLLIASPVLAGEKIQITGSTSVQIPKPRDIVEDSKKSRTYDGPSGRSTYEGSLLPQTGPVQSNPLAEKQFKEAIDKKKNWIFINPYESQYDSKTEQFLKGEKGTALYNHPLMKDEEKGVVQRFIEENKTDREMETGHNGKDSGDRSDRKEEREKREPQSSTEMNSELLSGDNQSKSGQTERGLVLTSPIAKNPFASDERNQFEERLEKNPLKDSLLGSNNKASERTAFTREERQARDAELSKIYQPRIGGERGGGIAVAPGGTDPLSTFDVTRQEATPFSGRKTDQIFNVGRPDPAASVGRNSPIFTGPPIGSAGAGLNARLPERSGFDINTRGPQASSFSSGISAPSANSPAQSLAPAPFVLPLPKRRF